MEISKKKTPPHICHFTVKKKTQKIKHYQTHYRRHLEKPCKCNKNTHLYLNICFVSTSSRSFCPAAISLSSCTSSVIFLLIREAFTPLTTVIILPFCKRENNTLGEFSSLSLHIYLSFGTCYISLFFPATGLLPMPTEVNTKATTASTSSGWTFLVLLSPFLLHLIFRVYF